MITKKIHQQLQHTLEKFDINNLGTLYRGKVRDNYVSENQLTMITTDRVSAFDHTNHRGDHDVFVAGVW